MDVHKNVFNRKVHLRDSIFIENLVLLKKKIWLNDVHRTNYKVVIRHHIRLRWQLEQLWILNHTPSKQTSNTETSFWEKAVLLISQVQQRTTKPGYFCQCKGCFSMYMVRVMVFSWNILPMPPKKLFAAAYLSVSELHSPVRWNQSSHSWHWRKTLSADRYYNCGICTNNAYP